MNRNEPLTELKTATQDGLDRMLSSFFKSEMPAPWPAARATVVASRPMPASRLPERQPVVTGARVSLAVSVALLLGGCWLLSERTVDAPVPKPSNVGVPIASPIHPQDIGKRAKNHSIVKPMP